MRLIDVADHVGVARSTAHRLLATLVGRGFVAQLENRSYSAGPQLAIGTDYPSRIAQLRRAAEPVLASLTAHTEETSSLQILDGAFVTFSLLVESPHVLRVAARTGRRLPAHRASGGKAILGARPWPQVQAILDPLVHDADQLALLRRELRGVRQRGFAINNQATEPGVIGVGCVVLSPDGPPVAAVCVAAPTLRASRSRVRMLAASTIAAATDLADRLPLLP